MRAIASLSLALMTIIFLLSWRFRAAHPALPYLQAFAEAAMVGGLADWFAIVALFRRPLGLPIPHTAIIPANKTRIGRSLGDFFSQHLLDADSLRALLRRLDLPTHAGHWLQEPENARKLMARLDESGIADKILLRLSTMVELRRGEIRELLGEHSSRWIPSWLDDKMANTLTDALLGLLQHLRDPEHPWRTEVDLTGIGNRLVDDPQWRQTAQEWIERAVEQAIVPRKAQIGDFVAGLVAGWDDHVLIERLEAEVGADLHYIRLNGTLVGGLVGLVLFGITQWLG